MATPWTSWQYKWSRCKRCPLHNTATEYVLYRGDRKPDILFIGEAPGPDEDALGQPFIGRSGQLLDSLIHEVDEGLRHFTSGFANILCCFPIKDPEVKEKRGNFRAPHRDEAAVCRPHLTELYHMLSPFAIVTLGKATHSLIPPEWKKLPIPVKNLQHPSYWLRTGGKSGLAYKRAKHELSQLVIEVFG